MDCIFCKIASKEAKSSVVLENERFIVIKDINPQAPEHMLVITKEHFTTLLDCKDKSLLGDMLLMAKEAAKKAGIDESGFRSVINTNEEGGQTVLHLHMHILGGRPLTGRMG